MERLPDDWRGALAPHMGKDGLSALESAVDELHDAGRIFPSRGNVFRALRETPLRQVRVVLLGQDPYHRAGQATGLAFAVPPGTTEPPSLRNIYREMRDDVGGHHPLGTHHAAQGVLLLNTALTVREGSAGSHMPMWRVFTSAAIAALGERDFLVWLLWGNHGKSYREKIVNPAHVVLAAAHPSPLARGAFFGCRHFSRCNREIEERGGAPVLW